MALTFRTGSGGKGSALTIEELDNNFRHFTGSHEISGSLIVSSSLIVSGGMNISGSIIPTEAAATLGSVAHPFKDLFVSPDSIVFYDGTSAISTLNSNNLGKNEMIILIRSFLSRIKRLIELKKLQLELGNIQDTINNFKPPIFWKDKEIVQRQIEIWSNKEIYKLLENVNGL